MLFYISGASDRRERWMMDYGKLAAEAIKARRYSYCPYSGFAVGAALLTEEGKIYRGCNIESVSHTPTVCAERTAFFKAVSEGEGQFAAIAVTAGNKELGAPLPEYVAPCGVCRQVMAEFCGRDFKVILARSEEDYKVYTLEEILPLAFMDRSLMK